MELSFESFIRRYPQEVIENASLVRELILSKFGHIDEIIDQSAAIVGYNFGPGYKNTICTIIPSQKTIKLGFNHGSLINDPEGMLTGTGKVHKYVVINDFYNQQEYLVYLLDEAFKLGRSR